MFSRRSGPSLVAAAVCRPRVTPPPARTAPMTRKPVGHDRVGGERRQQRVLLAAAEHALASQLGSHRGLEAARRRRRSAAESRSSATPLAAATRDASRRRPSERSIIDVAPASRRDRTERRSVGPGGGAPPPPRASASGRPVSRSVQPGPGQPERAGDRDDVADAGTGAEHRPAALEVAERRHRDDQHTLRRRGQVAADDRAARRTGQRRRGHGPGRAPSPPRSTGP